MAKPSECRNGGPGRDTLLVSVIMGTFNGEKYLRPAIHSILSQTLRDFELIVVDDGSTDRTSNILEEFQDQRVRVTHNDQNLGIAGTLNKAIALATGRYVAVQDHDDISLHHRLETLAQYLDGHPEVGLVGSSCRIIDPDGITVQDARVKCEDAVLRWALLWYNPFFHTTLMIRRSVLDEIGGYSSDPMCRFSEDYEMISRVARQHRVANLPQPLACHRRHFESASARNAQRQFDSGTSIPLHNVLDLWRRSGEQLSLDTVAYRYEGMRSFQFEPAGKRPSASAERIRCAPHYLKTLECAFSGYTPGLRQSKRIRADRYCRWGRHAVALAIRQNWDAKVRAALLLGGVRMLSQSVGLLIKPNTHQV